MSRNGSGTYDLPGADLTNGTLADATEVMTKLDDIASALTASIAKDGQTTPTAALPMGTFNHTGVGAATARTHYAQAAQIADGALTYGGVAGGTANALTITPSPAISAYVIGQVFQFKTGASANTTAVTLDINTVGAGAVTWPDGTALAADDLPANSMVTVQVQALTPVFHLQTQTRSLGAYFPTTGGTITSTDASAYPGPTIDLHRDSASPTASDEIGEITFSGEESGSAKQTFARIYGEIIDPTAASEDGRLHFETVVAGTEASRAYVQHGLVVGAATDGDKGDGTINAVALYEQGVRAKPWPVLATLTASSSAELDFTDTDSTLYAGYYCKIESIRPATDNTSLEWLVSTDGGSNFITTGTYANVILSADSATPASGSSVTSSAPALAQNVGNVAGEGISGFVVITSGGAVAHGTKLNGTVGFITAAGAAKISNPTASNSTATAVDAFRFRIGSGNIASGTIRIYGIPK